MHEDPIIGKDVIESLTLGMYENPLFIYREYVQNAADAIDQAIERGLVKKGEEEILINIDENERTISIEDNAIGITSGQVMPILRNIANSTKQRGKNKGFRGIGRLGGLGYCSKLIFETSAVNEEVKSIMTWDAERLKDIINNRQEFSSAQDVLKQVTELNTIKEQADKHYFKVTLFDVTLDDLLRVEDVSDYLSMVAPVEITSQFIYRNKILAFMKEHGLTLDTYNIYVNHDQIYKPYTAAIYEDNKGGKKKVDDIYDVDFLYETNERGELIYWGWYSLSSFKGQMTSKNIARGLRLRKSNIQIGDEEICKKFFTKTNDQRFSFYFFGEIHAVSNGLIPNSRRDYFSESAECIEFEDKIKIAFLKLKDLCYDVSQINGFYRTISKAKETEQKIVEKEKTGYTSKKEREDLYNSYEELKKKQEKAERNLQSKLEKIKSGQSPAYIILSKIEQKHHFISPNSVSIGSPETGISKDSIKKTKFRTDRSVYSRYSKNEKKLIGKIYSAIKNSISDEAMCEALINKIEEEITK
ncbi:MAG: ATP-binding protein [Bacteroidales bacterium]|nr:ATP-binding protein [Bacteroidales bacterium]